MVDITKEPSIRFKGFNGAWEKLKLGNCFDERQQRSAEGELISVTIKSGIKKFEDLARHNNSSEDKSHYKRVEIGDIAYNSMRMWQGASGYSPYNGILSPAYTVIIPKENVDSLFFSFMFKKPKMIQTFQLRSQGITSDTWNLKYPAFSEIEIWMPKKSEQEPIAKFLYNVDNLIILQQQKIEKLQNVKKSMLEKMFPKNAKKIPEVRFSGFGNAWKWRRLGDMGTTFAGLSGKSKHDFGHGNAEYITYMNVYSNPIAEIKQTKSVEIDPNQNEVKFGDVLFTTSSETPDEVGMSSIWLDNRPNVYLNSFCFGYRLSTKIDPYFLGFMLRSPSVRKKFIFLAQGFSRFNISKNKIMDITVPLTDIDEQHKVGKFFLAVDNLIAFHQQKLEKLRNIKNAFLEKMFI